MAKKMMCKICGLPTEAKDRICKRGNGCVISKIDLTINVPNLRQTPLKECQILREQLQSALKAIETSENHGFVSSYAKAAWGLLLTHGKAADLSEWEPDERDGEDPEHIWRALSEYGGLNYDAAVGETNAVFSDELAAGNIDWSTASDPYADNSFHNTQDFNGTFSDHVSYTKWMHGTVSTFDNQTFHFFSTVDTEDTGLPNALEALIQQEGKQFQDVESKYLEHHKRGWHDD